MPGDEDDNVIMMMMILVIMMSLVSGGDYNYNDDDKLIIIIVMPGSHTKLASYFNVDKLCLGNLADMFPYSRLWLYF